MKVAWMERFGEPAEVLACKELPDPDAAGRGEVLLNLVASPINPADLFLIQGIYAILPNLPYAAGMEGVARVASTGDGVDHLSEGDLVLLPPGVGAWREQFALPRRVYNRCLRMWTLFSCRCSRSTRRRRTSC